MSIKKIGCCGAYCGSCKSYKENLCLGCKLGYDNGERDISKAKCKIKICCVQKGFNSCADCDLYNSCNIIQDFYGKNGYKYKKYQEATEYIKVNGYGSFIKITDNWIMQYGKYK